MSLEKKNCVSGKAQDAAANFTKAETDLLKEALKRSHAERFFFATRLYKIGQTLSRAAITHKKDTLTK